MKVRILSCAEAEIAEAMDFYNSQYPGLGYDFAVETKECLKRIQAFPHAWPSFSISTKRCLLNRFPYGVLFQCKQDEIIVFAVMHLKQNPAKWNKIIDRLR